jgi:hypothetical protein
MLNNYFGYLLYKVDTGEVLQFTTDPTPEDTNNSNIGLFEYYLNSTEIPDGYISNNTFHILPPRPNKFYNFNYNTKQWEDSRSLLELKASKWAEIKKYRDEEEFSTFIWNGIVLDGDSESQQRIIGTALSAVLDPTIQVEWTLADNTVQTLTSQNIIDIGKALSTKITSLHAYTRGIREQIQSAIDTTSLDSIVWNFIET